MPIREIEQPNLIIINGCLRLRKYSEPCDFALKWYQDKETLLLVDGENCPYNLNRLHRMYHYLCDKGEVYFIEFKEKNDFLPIGDVSFWKSDMPIVLDRDYRGKGIGKQVVQALVERAIKLGYDYLEIAEIYDYNIGSQRLFESIGFTPKDKTEKGHSYILEL